MRFTHKDVLRGFRVPCSRWLIPTIGSLLCILLMKSISKATVYRFLLWTGIGQIIYFSYGFWHSKRRKLRKTHGNNSMLELTTSGEISMEIRMGSDSESDLDLQTVKAKR